jgi:hypothetical protein
MRSTRWPRGSDRSASSALRWAGGCLATAALLSIAGCVPSTAEPAVTPSATASAAAPVFASDEEALAAASKAFATYLKVSDAIGAAGGLGTEALAPLVSEQYLKQSSADFAYYVERGFHAVGESSFDTVAVQHVVENGGSAEVVVYLCLDVSAVSLVDAAGNDVTSATRKERAPLEVEFETLGASRQMIIVRSNLWSGDDFCTR